jgi:hypothetical protein
METLGGRGCILTTSALDGVSGQSHARAALWPRGKDPKYPLARRLGGPQSRSGLRGYGKNLLPLLGIEPQSPGRPVHSQTLYFLSYPATYTIYIRYKYHPSTQLSDTFSAVYQIHFYNPHHSFILQELLCAVWSSWQCRHLVAMSWAPSWAAMAVNVLIAITARLTICWSKSGV